MFYVLVKFFGQDAPVLFGTTHISHASKLATMTDVEWVSPTIANGAALARPTPFGGAYRVSVVGPQISGYRIDVDGGEAE